MCWRALCCSADITIKPRNRASGGDDADKEEEEDSRPVAAAATEPAAKPASPLPKQDAPAAPKPAGGGAKPGSGKPAARNATAAPAAVTAQQLTEAQQAQQVGQQMQQDQQRPPVRSASLNSTLPAAAPQPQKPRAAATAAGGDMDDACKELGSGLHALPLTCPKFLLCASGKAWVLYCPKASASRDACALGGQQRAALGVKGGA